MTQMCRRCTLTGRSHSRTRLLPASHKRVEVDFLAPDSRLQGGLARMGAAAGSAPSASRAEVYLCTSRAPRTCIHSTKSLSVMPFCLHQSG